MATVIPDFEDLNEARAWAKAVVADIERINEVLNDKACDRDLCDEYDAALREACERTTHVKLDPRTIERTIRIDLPIDVTANHGLDIEDLARDITSALYDSAFDSWLRDRLGFEGEKLETNRSTYTIPRLA